MTRCRERGFAHQVVEHIHKPQKSAQTQHPVGESSNEGGTAEEVVAQ